MLEPLRRLFSVANDDELCSGIFDHIWAFYNEEPNPSEMPEPERVVLLVYPTTGIIGNGGFNYLFESDLPGDPDYSLAADSYERIGCEPATDAFRQAMNLFPGGRPPRDCDERLLIYRSGTPELRGPIDQQFFRASDQVVPALARYIRQHREDYARLEEERRKPKEKSHRDSESAPRSLDPVAVGIKELPHWARVAFAAHCARIVFPLFDTFWPNALPKRRAAVQNAIRLAEEAAANGRASDDLTKAVVGAVSTAGAALRTLYGIPEGHEDDEPGPADGNIAMQAAAVAKTAENAAEAARHPSHRSGEFACSAYAFGRDLVWESHHYLHEKMAADFDVLRRAARRGRWKDRTPVPSWAFTITNDEGERDKPWWKFW
jgi:hypothetical protein